MAYCTATDIDNVLSSTGVDLRTDDGTEATLVAEVIEEADQEIEQAAHYLYTAASLATNVWVNHRAKDIAAFLLCERRGNPAPASLARKFDRAIELLEKVRIGGLLIPGAVMSKALAPTMSNVRSTLRPFPRSVIEKTRSTGKPEGYNQSNVDPLDRTNATLNYSI